MPDIVETVPGQAADQAAVRLTLQRFQEGYARRDKSKLAEIMDLFIQGDDCELIGIGAAERGGNEWFQGRDQIREIIESDWTYWGDVLFDVAGARISLLGDVAWLSTGGQLIQTETFDRAMSFYLNQMKDLLSQEDVDVDTRLVETTHYGMRRLRERHKGKGYAWPFVLTAVLVRENGVWRFHTLHWSMPVD